jgi:hypothetical protein
MALGDYYCGIASKRSYSQVVHLEVVPNMFVDGVPTSFSRNLYTSDCYEEVYEFEGVPTSLKDTTGNVNVREVGADSDHAIILTESVVDGSGGSAVCVKESVSVQRIKMSPHMWRIEVTHFRANLKMNGTQCWPAPSEW